FADSGPSAYPECADGQSDIFNQVQNWQEGDITDVLFANSTQVAGGETIAFPGGMAFTIVTEAREIATSIHWLNTSSQEVVAEVVYDFFTMPDDQMTEVLVPFVFDNQAFTVPPRTTTDVTATCELGQPGNI